MVKCPIKGKEVGCDGVCESVSMNGVRICPVRLKALDLALNGITSTSQHGKSNKSRIEYVMCSV